jgi:hypothetical protein
MMVTSDSPCYLIRGFMELPFVVYLERKTRRWVAGFFGLDSKYAKKNNASRPRDSASQRFAALRGSVA